LDRVTVRISARKAAEAMRATNMRPCRVVEGSAVSGREDEEIRRDFLTLALRFARLL